MTPISKNAPISYEARHDATDWMLAIKKVASRSIGILVKGFDYLLNLIPPIGLSNLHNYYYNKPLNEGINKAQLEKYLAVTHQKAWPKIDAGKEKWLKKKDLSAISTEKVDQFFHGFKQILAKIAKAKSNNNIQAEDIRSSLNEMVKSTVYQTLRATANHPAIQMLKSLSFAGTTGGATQVIKEYGAKVSENQPKERQTINKVARDVDVINSNPWSFNRNGPLSIAWWAITHLSYAWRTAASYLFPELFYAENGNAIFQAHAVKHPGSPWKRTPLTFGPTPTQPLYFDAHLPHLQENNMCEVRIILQDTKSNEGIRVKEFYRRTKAYRKDGTLALLTLPFDMRPMKDPASFMGKKFTVGSFMLNYAKFFMAKNGIADKSTGIDQIKVHAAACRSETFSDQKVSRPIIPKNILSDAKLKSCFTSAKNIFSALFKRTHLDQMSLAAKKQVAITMQLVTQALLIFAALGKVGKGAKEISSLCIHCKVCVDRAVVLMIAMILLDYIPTAKEASLEADLPANIVHLVHGIAVGRPEMVSCRLGLTKRVNVLSDFLHVLGDVNFGKLKSSVSSAFTRLAKPVASSNAP